MRWALSLIAGMTGRLIHSSAVSVGRGVAAPLTAGWVGSLGVDLGVAGATQQLIPQIGTTVGINLLEKVQLPNLASMFGAVTFAKA